jgi:glycosyltransferase involved in cell wall biosynthesis
MGVRLLLLVHGLPMGGTEVMVAHLARRFRTQRLEVTIGCLDEVGDLGRALLAEGFSVELYSRRGGFDPILPFKIARSVRRGRVDLVHAHQYTPFFYGVLAKILTGAPLIFTEHGRAYPDVAGIRRRVFNRFFSRLVNRVTAVSLAVRESLDRVERGFDPESIEIIHNGIDLDLYPPLGDLQREEARRRLGLPAPAPVIGTVGRLHPVKNHALLLRAFRMVLFDHPEAVLVVVGDGPERVRLEALADDLGVRSAVRFLGTRSDVGRILPAFDVFALSSFSEGMPMTLIEAMAASVPIVSTAVGGIAEIVRNGREGVLIDGIPPFVDVGELEASEYVSQFALALKRVVAAPDWARQLAANARKRAEHEFALDRICRQYLALYEAIVPAPRPMLVATRVPLKAPDGH